MSEIRFSSKEHEKFFYQMLAKCGKHDSYYSSFFYCVGISEDTRNHVDRMFDFKERLIKPEALHEGWQTGGSARLTRLAFNLWNGYVEKKACLLHTRCSIVAMHHIFMKQSA